LLYWFYIYYLVYYIFLLNFFVLFKYPFVKWYVTKEINIVNNTDIKVGYSIYYRLLFFWSFPVIFPFTFLYIP
jgi:hypothetical protein